jgi:hypothetical protein
MRNYWKYAFIAMFALLAIVLIENYGFSHGEGTNMMHVKGMMGGAPHGRWGNMMNRSNTMMGNMNKLMYDKMHPVCQGMMHVNGMGMMMHRNFQNMQYMNQYMESVMNNSELMEDEEMKGYAEEMQNHMKAMGEAMEEAMINMEKMSDRMEELELE